MARLGRGQPRNVVIIRNGQSPGTANSSTLTGSIVSTGAAIKAVAKVAAGSTTATGALTKAAAFVRSGSSTATGLAVKQTSITRSGSLTATGVAIKQAQMTRGGSTTTIGAVYRVAFKVVGGSISTSGNVTKATTKTLAGSCTPTGALGMVKNPGGSGPTAYYLLIGGSISSAGAPSKSISAKRTGSCAAAGVAMKQPQLVRAGSSATSGLVARQTQLIRAGLSGTSGLVARTQARVVVGSIVPTGVIGRLLGKKFTGSLTATGAITKSKVQARLLTGSITTTGRLVKTIGRLLRGQIGLYGLTTSPKFPPAPITVVEPVRTYYPATDAPTRKALFDVDQRTTDNDNDIAALQSSTTSLQNAAVGVGPTSARPTGTARYHGKLYFDTTTNQLLAWDATNSVWSVVHQLAGWTAYTPVLTGATTNPNIGSTGTAVGAYQRVDGRTIAWRVYIQAGGSGIAAGSGNYMISLPVAGVTQQIVGTGWAYDGNFWSFQGDEFVSGFARLIGIQAGTYMGSAYHPMTAAGHVYAISGTYEAAT